MHPFRNYIFRQLVYVEIIFLSISFLMYTLHTGLKRDFYMANYFVQYAMQYKNYRKLKITFFSEKSTDEHHMHSEHHTM